MQSIHSSSGPVPLRPDVIDLSGIWTCVPDPDDRWLYDRRRFDLPYIRHSEYQVSAFLPGTTDTNQIGERITTRTIRHLNRKFRYVGPVWWQRDIVVPREWAGKRIELRLERCMRESRVFLDSTYIGSRDSLSTPHVYRLDPFFEGGRNFDRPILLSIRTDNRPKIQDAIPSATADDCQTEWNGIIGSLILRARPHLCIEHVALELLPDLHTVRIRVEIANSLVAETAEVKTATLTVALGDLVTRSETIAITGDPLQRIEMVMDLGSDVPLWDDVTPRLIDVHVKLASKAGVDEMSFKTGLRRVWVDGKRLMINQRELFLRGTVDGGMWPPTGHCPMDLDTWLMKFRVLREHGINHVRCHSWCPPENAFIAADQMGIILQVEGPFWHSIGTDDALDRYMFAETAAIVRTYGHHPSFCLMAHGNEPRGPQSSTILFRWIEEMKRLSTNQLFTAGTGWPLLSNNDFHVLMTADAKGRYVEGKGLRLHCWGQQLEGVFHQRDWGTRIDFSDACAYLDKPVISHEVGQWVVFPNFEEVEEYDGVLDARDIEVIRDLARRKGIEKYARAYHLASGKLQFLCYKAEIEAALSTQGLSGFQLLGLVDYRGEGMAMVGLLDPNWKPRAYYDPKAFTQFCNALVPLARFDKHVWRDSEEFVAQIEAVNFTGREFDNVQVRWVLSSKNSVHASGKFLIEKLRHGKGLLLGTLRVPLRDMPSPCRLTLAVSIEDADGRILGSNEWPLWCYPSAPAPPPSSGIEIAHKVDKTLLERLVSGARVLLCPDPPPPHKTVVASFAPMFWSSYWTRGQLPRTLGLLVNHHHPALAAFPTEEWSDWQWFEIVNRSRPLILDELPMHVEPIVHVIDDFFRMHRLGLITEMAVGKGRVIVCGCDLTTNLEHRPAADQLRRSLLAYLENLTAEAPEVSPDEFARFFGL